MLAFDSAPPPPHEEITKHPHNGNESYLSLVWRRLRRSWTGMMGLILVGLLLFMAIFADFFAPMDPKATDVGFAPPQLVSLRDKDGNFAFPPRVYALGESEELDPVTFQPLLDENGAPIVGPGIGSRPPAAPTNGDAPPNGDGKD